MGRADYYAHGDHNVICDASGFKVKASECRMNADGRFIHRDFWDAGKNGHPQRFVRARKDKQSVAIARPEQADQFIEDVYPNGITADDL